MACETVALSDDRAKRFGDSRVYLLCGKAIVLEMDDIDMSDPKDLAGMVGDPTDIFGSITSIVRTLKQHSTWNDLQGGVR